MEKILSAKNLNKALAQPTESSKIKLQNGHLWIQAEIAVQTIGNTRQVYAVYYENINTILLAPDSDADFKATHKTVLLFVKDKNTLGDKSVSIREIIADNSKIDGNNRDLVYLITTNSSVLQITL